MAAGSGDLNPAAPKGLPNWASRGPFWDFAAIAGAEAYLAFVYTTLFDGVPTVLAEAAGMGLPIVAPDAPSVGEFVIDGRTGLLLASLIDDAEMAQAYADAIARLRREPALRRRLAAGAYDRVLEVHSPRPYRAALEQVLKP